MKNSFSLELLVLIDSLTCELGSCSVSEPEAEYGLPEWGDRKEAEELLHIVAQTTARLHELGLTDEEIRARCRQLVPPERLHITSQYKILLPERDNQELKMRPLSKALFILFLKHPEGISFKSMSDYREEILDIYATISGRTNMSAIRESVNRLINPTENAINLSRTRVNQALERYFNRGTIGQYLINGRARSTKNIAVDRDYISWGDA